MPCWSMAKKFKPLRNLPTSPSNVERLAPNCLCVFISFKTIALELFLDKVPVIQRMLLARCVDVFEKDL